MPGCKLQLTVTVSGQLCAVAYEEVLKEYGKKADLPGFRQPSAKATKKGGKKGGGGSKPVRMPRDMLVQYIGGEERVKAAAVEQLMLSTIPVALQQYKDEVIADSEAVQSSADELIQSFDMQKGMSYVISIEVPPTVTWKGDYRDIQVEVEDAATPEQITAEVESRLQEERKKAAKMQVVVDRGLQYGDMAVVDTTLAEVDAAEGVPPVAFDRQNMQLDTETADQQYLPGVVEQLEGAKVGDTREFEVTLPADYEAAVLRGKKVAVKVTLKELFAWDLPEMNDSWASKLFPGCSLDKVREVLTTAFTEQAQEATEQRVRRAVSAAIGKLAECEVPEKLVRDFGEVEYQARLLEAHGKGSITYDMMEQLATEQLLNEFVNKNRADLEAMVRETAAVEKIFDEQGLAVGQEEVEIEAARAAADFQAQGQEFDEGRLREQVVETLKAMRVLDWLKAHATIKMVPPAVDV